MTNPPADLVVKLRRKHLNGIWYDGQSITLDANATGLQTIEIAYTANYPYEEMRLEIETQNLSGSISANFDNFKVSKGHNEVAGGGTNGKVAFKYRVHDAAIGRFLSRDPLFKDYPWNSPYAFSENRVIDAFELEGLEAVLNINMKKWKKGVLKNTNALRVIKDANKISVMHDWLGKTTQVEIERDAGPWQHELEGAWYSNPFTKFGAWASNGSNLEAAHRIVTSSTSPWRTFESLASGNDALWKKYRNAYTHVSGQSLISALMGEEFAKYAGDIHERRPEQAMIFNGDQNFYNYANIEGDAFVDLINNEYGRQLGSKIASQWGDGGFSVEKTATYLNSLHQYMIDTFPELEGTLKTDYSSDDQFVKDYYKNINDAIND